MTRNLIIPLAILALLLPGCMGVAAIGATAWAGVQTISRMARVIAFAKSNREKPMGIGLCDVCCLPKPQRYMGYGIMLCAQCEDEWAPCDVASEIVTSDKEEEGDDDGDGDA